MPVDTTASELRAQLFGDPHQSALKDSINISPSPKNLLSEVLAIRRSREVPIDWDFVFSGRLMEVYTKTRNPKAFATGETLRYFWWYFRDLWGLNDKSFDKLTGRIAAELEVQKPFARPKVVNGKVVVGQIDIAFEAPQTRWVLRHPIATDRLFLPEPRQGVTITAADFQTWDSFAILFQTKIELISNVIAKTDQVTADRVISQREDVDLAPALIMQQYYELQALAALAKKLSDDADKVVQPDPLRLLDQHEIVALNDGVLRMKKPALDRATALRRLADRASALGYILNVTDKPITHKYAGGTRVETIDPGKLYQPYVTKVTWITQHPRVGQRESFPSFPPLPGQHLVPPIGLLGFLDIPSVLSPGASLIRNVFGGGGGNYVFIESRKHVEEVTLHKEVIVDFDPWTEKETELATNEGLTSYRFEKLGSDYRCQTGQTLAEIMQACDGDEQFRRQAAVWLPVYEEKLTQGEILSRYVIFKRPYKGIKPVRLPRLYIEETLNYRTGWRRVELGELVYTINLAPLEERTVTIDQRTTRRREETRSTTSILDLTETDSTELSTEIEKEARTETDLSMSAGVQGSYAGIGGKADVNSTTKQFSRKLERLATKAAHNITKNTRQEIRTSITATEDFSRSELTAIKLRNINEGRTLNLSFFRMYNVYDAGIFAEDLKLISEAGVEIVAGSGVTLPRTFGLQQLIKALNCLDLELLPFPAGAGVQEKEYLELLGSYWSYIIDQLLNLLGNEYGQKGQLGGALAFTKKLTDNIQTSSARKNRFDGKSVDEIYALVRAELDKLGSEILITLENSELGKSPVQPLHQLRVGSQGLYVDSYVGSMPATEVYSEEMRVQEVRRRQAEVAKQHALATYYNRLAQSPMENPTAPADLVGSLQSNGHVYIRLPEPAAKGQWSILYNGSTIAVSTSKNGDTTLDFDPDPPLEGGDLNVVYCLVGPDGKQRLLALIQSDEAMDSR